MNTEQLVAVFRRMIRALENETNRDIVRKYINAVENTGLNIAQAISGVRRELRGDGAASGDNGLNEALDILREAVAESNRSTDEPMNKRERDFAKDVNSLFDEIAEAKKRKEKIKEKAINHRSQLASDDLTEYNKEIQALIDNEDKQLKAKRNELDELIFNREINIGANKKMEVFKQQRTKTLGEHFIENASESLKNRSGRFSISTPEYTRAAADTHWTGQDSNVFLPALTQVDRTVVQDYRRPTVLNLFRWGTITGQAISYFYEVGKEGAVTAVAEKGKKPQLHYTYGMKTDALSKVAGFIKVSNEMIDDLPFIVTEINNRLIYDIEMAVENQILNGSGTAPNVLGLLNREGVQTEVSTSLEDNPDALFRGATKIQTATGLMADGIIINPLDYQKLRLKKDGNGQYLGGGFFQGQYGNGGLQWEPPIWGFRTIVSPAVAAGTALVGAFTQGATPYTKGGIVVESTNSNVDDFEHNLVTIRAEQRIALAVRNAAAFTKVTLTNGL